MMGNDGVLLALNGLWSAMLYVNNDNPSLYLFYYNHRRNTMKHLTLIDTHVYNKDRKRGIKCGREGWREKDNVVSE